MSQLWWSLHGVKLKWILHAVFRKAGEADLSHCSPFLVKGTFSSWEFPLGTERCLLGIWDYRGKMKLFFPFCAVVLRFFVPPCCLSFLSGFLSSPGVVFVNG